MTWIDISKNDDEIEIKSTILSNKFKLRPYQEDAISSIKDAFALGVNKQVIVLATGLGKTVIFSHLISDMIKSTGKKALVLAHREELLNQAKDKINKIDSSLKVDIEKAGDWADSKADVIVASVATIGRVASDRIKRLNPRDFGIVVIDEAHHSSADSYRNIIKYFGLLKGEDWNKETLLLGVTATPSRSDNKGIDAIFDKVPYAYGIVQAIKDKWLVRIKAWRIDTDTDLSKVRKTAGDFNLAQLGEAVNNEDRNGLVIKAYQERAQGKQALCFAVDIEHAVSLTKQFNEVGIPTDYIIGTSTNRQEILSAFKERKINVIVNCMVLTEGFDEPNIEVILMARPTQSGILFQQMVGRGTRTNSGKTCLTVIDFVDNTLKQNLQTTSSLLGLKGSLNFKGRDILEVQEIVDKLLEIAPDADLSILDIDRIQYAIAEVDLLSSLEVPDEIARFTRLDWYKFAEDVYRIGLSNNQSMILKKTITGDWLLVEHEYNKETRTAAETEIGVWAELEVAINKADYYISKAHPEIMVLVRSNATWRSKEMSTSQHALLSSLHVSEKVINSLDKGKASRLISRLLDMKKK